MCIVCMFSTKQESLSDNTYIDIGEHAKNLMNFVAVRDLPNASLLIPFLIFFISLIINYGCYETENKQHVLFIFSLRLGLRTCFIIS